MLDFGWLELLVIGVGRCIVIGPRTFGLFRQLGRFMAKIRSMVRDVRGDGQRRGIRGADLART